MPAGSQVYGPLATPQPHIEQGAAGALWAGEYVRVATPISYTCRRWEGSGIAGTEQQRESPFCMLPLQTAITISVDPTFKIH